MKHLRSALVLLLVVITGFASCSSGRGSAGIPDRPESISAKPLQFTLPRPEVWELPNGIKVYFRRDTELPLVKGKIFFGGGTLFDPIGKAGLFSTLGAEMREGGAGKYSADELDRMLDQLAAGVESSYSSDYGSVGFGCMTEDIEQVFGLFTQVVRSPRFDEKRLKLWKESNIQSIKRRTESADIMTGLTFGQLVYGAESAYGEILSERSINSITRKELQALHNSFVVPAGAQLVITGDIERAELERLVSRYFGDWTTPAGAVVNPALPGIGKGAEPGVYVIQHEFDQSSVVIGHLGPPRIFPELIESGIYSRILGANSFSSRLMQEIRTKLGLAYSVHGAVFPGPGKGTFQVEMGTRNDGVARAVSTVLKLIRESREVPPEAAELDAAKRGIEQSFVFKFSSSEAITQRVALQNRFGFPEDFDDSYLSKVRSVQPNDVKEVGKKFVDPDRLVIVITGRASAEEVARDLSAVGVNLPVYRVEFGTEPKVVGRIN
jgi:zinc protease